MPPNQKQEWKPDRSDPARRINTALPGNGNQAPAECLRSKPLRSSEHVCSLLLMRPNKRNSLCQQRSWSMRLEFCNGRLQYPQTTNSTDWRKISDCGELAA